jgi:hypothetical protein
MPVVGGVAAMLKPPPDAVTIAVAGVIPPALHLGFPIRALGEVAVGAGAYRVRSAR